MQCCRGEAAKGVRSCWEGNAVLPRRGCQRCGAAGEGDAVLPRRGCQGSAELLGREIQCCRGEAAKNVELLGGRCSAAEERLPRVCGAAGEGDALLPRRGCQGCVELLGREMQCHQGEATKGVWSCWEGNAVLQSRGCQGCGAAGEGDAVLLKRGCQGCVELLGKEMHCCREEAAKGVWSCCGGRCSAVEERLPRECRAAANGDAVLPRRGCQGTAELLRREMHCCRGEAAKRVCCSAQVLTEECDEFQTTKSLKHEPKKKCTLVKHDEKDYFEESKRFYILEL
ncbi:hypothetical protein NDU88_000038 [Pleurodeles waltl]|uniref:Uncharacterized protein n=1 Tax=Pleurodeles waltl TaxID=8319 RepID=A0AAV7SVV6_PLEWA|nr:hypothetical protein NDU88_000038 [Pleurodeles waltl]